MFDKHLSSRFDADLKELGSRVIAMGGLVESQITTAMQALEQLDEGLADRVVEAEARVNLMEVQIDEECGNIIVRRQPAARDLRMLLAFSKTVTNLERVGDEAEKIAKRTKGLLADDRARSINISEIKISGRMAVDLLRHALDALDKLDMVAAAGILRDDKAIDEEFRAFVRKLIGYMMEEPRTISVGLDYLFIAKAIERIGDHAKNIAELIIYIVKGTDVRHFSREQVEREALSD